VVIEIILDIFKVRVHQLCKDSVDVEIIADQVHAFIVDIYA